MATSPGDAAGWATGLSVGTLAVAMGTLAVAMGTLAAILVLAWRTVRHRRKTHSVPEAGVNRTTKTPRPGKIPGVSVLVLVRDQAGQIEGFMLGLLNWVQSASGLGRATEITVVDHGSRDDTPAILSRLARRHACLQIVRLPSDLGQGRTACDIGLLSCTYRTVLVLDLLGLADTRPVLRSLGRLLNQATATQRESDPATE